jgi:hypothetical protein
MEDLAFSAHQLKRTMSNWRSVVGIVCLPFFLLCLYSFGLSLLHKQAPESLENLQTLWPLAIVPVGVLLNGIWKRRIPERLRVPVDRLAACNDVRAIPALWHGRLVQDKEYQLAIISALARLLKKVSEADADIFSAADLRDLCGLMYNIDTPLNRSFTSADYYEVAVGTVHALGHVGGEEALKALLRLESSTSNTEISRRLQSAAIKVLPILRERVRRQRTGEGLLRASSVGAASPAQLLRASPAIVSEDPAVLMRASDTRDGPSVE